LVSAGATITAFTPLRKTVVEYPFGKTLRLALCIFAFVRACHAERGYLVIQVADIHNQPVAGIELATKGSSESGTTDRFGRTRIKLDSQIKVNDWVAMQIVRSPKGKDLVLISPWDAHAQVPPFDNETVNLLPLVVATRGDRALLENGKAVIAMVAQINKAMTSVDTVTQRNASSAEELSSTAEELAAQSEALQQLMSFFRVAGERTAASRRVSEHRPVQQQQHLTPAVLPHVKPNGSAVEHNFTRF